MRVAGSAPTRRRWPNLQPKSFRMQKRTVTAISGGRLSSTCREDVCVSRRRSAALKPPVSCPPPASLTTVGGMEDKELPSLMRETGPSRSWNGAMPVLDGPLFGGAGNTRRRTNIPLFPPLPTAFRILRLVPSRAKDMAGAFCGSAIFGLREPKSLRVLSLL